MGEFEISSTESHTSHYTNGQPINSTSTTSSNSKLQKYTPNTINRIRTALYPAGINWHIADAYQWSDFILTCIHDSDPIVTTAVGGGDVDLLTHPAIHLTPEHATCMLSIIPIALAAIDAYAKTSDKSTTYAGIGSRRLPDEWIPKIHEISKKLSKAGYTLRSGGAIGADTAFERYSRSSEIYVPFSGYNKRVGNAIDVVHPDAFVIASLLHPKWDNLSKTAQALMARNTHQILGKDLNSPADFVVCWTPDGAYTEQMRTVETGGTGQAIALASRWKIPVFNLNHPSSIPPTPIWG